MATNDFLSQFRLKRISQSYWFNLIHVLLLLIVIVGLGFCFLLILMNIKVNKMSSIYFLLKKILIYVFLNTAPPAPPFFSWATRQGVLQHPQHPYFPR